MKATDTDGAVRLSNVFKVTVSPVKDPPVLDPIGPLSFDEGEQATILLKASDPDRLFGGTDTLSFSSTFSSGTPIFSLNSGTGAAHFIPSDAQVGMYTIEFSVSDASSLVDTEIVSMEIVDVNNPPSLAPMGKQTLNEDEPYEHQLEASDIDASDMDGLSYSVKFADGTDLFTMGTDGLITYTPVQEDVGTHKLTFTVTDTGGATDSEDVQFEIRNVNDAPQITQLEDQSVNRNQAFSMQATATDEDIGYSSAEFLEFSDNTKLFDIDPLTGWMNFTPTTDQVGNYSVTIIVSDLLDATASMTFGIEVMLNNTAPTVLITTQDNKVNFKAGRTIEMGSQTSDSDGDPLTYKWSRTTKKGSVELGTEESVSITKLAPGTHTIVLEVSDGIDTTTQEVEIKVTGGDGSTPGFDAATMLIAAVLVSLTLMVGNKRRDH